MVFHRLASAHEAAKHDDSFVLPPWVQALDSMSTVVSDLAGRLEDIWIVRFPQPVLLIVTWLQPNPEMVQHHIWAMDIVCICVDGLRGQPWKGIGYRADVKGYKVTLMLCRSAWPIMYTGI